MHILSQGTKLNYLYIFTQPSWYFSFFDQVALAVMDAITDHLDQHLDSLKTAEQMVCTLSTSASQTVYLQIDNGFLSVQKFAG